MFKRPNWARSKSIVCDCKYKDEMDVVFAGEVSFKDALDTYLIKNYNDYHDVVYGKKIHEQGYKITVKVKSVEIRLFYKSSSEYFYKNACLTCSTCLGWRHRVDCYIRYESPDEYFKSVICDKISENKNIIKRKLMAKDICNL